jgi:hypothetical protein
MERLVFCAICARPFMSQTASNKKCKPCAGRRKRCQYPPCGLSAKPAGEFCVIHERGFEPGAVAVTSGPDWLRELIGAAAPTRRIEHDNENR